MDYTCRSSDVGGDSSASRMLHLGHSEFFTTSRFSNHTLQPTKLQRNEKLLLRWQIAAAIMAVCMLPSGLFVFEDLNVAYRWWACFEGTLGIVALFAIGFQWLRALRALVILIAFNYTLAVLLPFWVESYEGVDAMQSFLGCKETGDKCARFLMFRSVAYSLCGLITCFCLRSYIGAIECVRSELTRLANLDYDLDNPRFDLPEEPVEEGIDVLNFNWKLDLDNDLNSANDICSPSSRDAICPRAHGLNSV